jgi:hypothetical protein
MTASARKIKRKAWRRIAMLVSRASITVKTERQRFGATRSMSISPVISACAIFLTRRLRKR